MTWAPRKRSVGWMWSPDQAGQGQEDPPLAKHRAVAKLGDMQV